VDSFVCCVDFTTTTSSSSSSSSGGGKCTLYLKMRLQSADNGGMGNVLFLALVCT